MVDAVADANFNIIIPEVRKAGDAYYDSAYEPWATNIAPGYDPLADMIEKAHAKGIEVHPWIVTYRIWNRYYPLPSDHIWRLHPEWACVTYWGSNRSGSYYYLDPGVPGVQQYVCDVVTDIISKYDVDGFNFDYVRYLGTQWGYNPLTKERFRQEYGYDPPDYSGDAGWDTWCDYRRRQVTDLVRKCYAEAIYLKPSVKMSVDTVGWMGVDPSVDFTGTRQYTDVFQDSKSWMEEHIIDLNILMNYKREYLADQAESYRLWSDFLATTAAATGRHAADGNASYLNYIEDTITQLQYSRVKGNGLCTYRYGYTSVDQQPDSAFFAAMKSAMFANPAPVPDMPWKSSPTHGILFGQVTDVLEPNHPIYQNWLYKATVTATGPETKTVETDATGTYAFMDLLPGDYTVTASHSVYGTAELSATVTAGEATKVNFALGPVLDPSDYKSIGDAKDPNIVPDGTVIGLADKVITVATGEFEGCVYVEEPDRATGMQVKLSATATHLSEGDRVSLIGLLATIDGERVLDHAAVQTQIAGEPLGALRTSVKDVDVAPSTTGLLAQCAGKVTDIGIGWFTMDDGSGSVKVLCPGLAVPGRGLAAQATGISRVESERVVRVRRQTDIKVVSKISVSSPPGAVGVDFNLISLPYVAMDPSPSAIFGDLAITNKLFWWDNPTQAFVSYSSANPSPFGNLCPGAGYALISAVASTMSYQGMGNSEADMRISLPKKGWSLIGQPFGSSAEWNNLMVTDGQSTVTLQDAIAAGRIGRIAFTWDSQSGNFGYVGTGARGSRFDDSLRPWRGYWVTSYQDGLAIIIPSGG